MKKYLFLFPVLAVVFASCTKSNNSPSTNASVMFVHGCATGTTSVNLNGEANNATVTGASNLAFLTNSGYQVVPSGSVNLSFFVTGLSVLTSETEGLTANTFYTAFAGGSITSPTLVFTSDDLSAPTSGNAKVRFVNLSPDGVVTSCYVGSTKVDSNVASESCTPFFEVSANTAGTKIGMFETTLTNSAIINSQVLSAGKIYTFMFTGTATGSGTSVLTLTAITNNN